VQVLGAQAASGMGWEVGLCVDSGGGAGVGSGVGEGKMAFGCDFGGLLGVPRRLGGWLGLLAVLFIFCFSMLCCFVLCYIRAQVL